MKLLKRIDDKRSSVPTIDSRLLSSKLLSEKIGESVTSLRRFLEDDEVDMSADGKCNKLTNTGAKISSDISNSDYNSLSKSEVRKDIWNVF